MAENKLVEVRRKQYSTLKGLLSNSSAPSGIFLYGSDESGKELLIREIIKELGLPHVTVNLVTNYEAKLVYQSIVGIIDRGQHRPIGNANDLVQALRFDTERREKAKGTNRVVLIEEAERLIGFAGNPMSLLLRLREYTKSPITVVFLSDLPPYHYRGLNPPPLVVALPPFSRPEVDAILTADAECYPGCSTEFFSQFVHLVLSVFYPVTRSLAELRFAVRCNYAAYRRPVESGELKETDVGRLWRRAESRLRQSVQQVYLRTGSEQSEPRNHTETRNHMVPQTQNRIEQQNHADSPHHTEPLASTTNRLSRTSVLDLPFYSKFLLIAAYLASHNPPKSDKRFFVKHHGKIRKSSSTQRSRHAVTSLTGPKAFPLDRMLAIFYHLVSELVPPQVSVLSQVATLESLKLLLPVGSDDVLDTPRYKCTVTLDCVRNVGKNVHIEVDRYLFDFIQPK